MAPFQPLLIHTDGVGDYRLNRFRLYFTIPPTRLSPDGQRLANGPFAGTRLDQMGGLLPRFFPQFFNPNIAHVTHQAQAWQGQGTLRFLITASAFGLSTRVTGLPGTILDYAVPDVHSDWVGMQWQDPTIGFTVQTLLRNFTEPEDHMAEGLSAGGTVAGGMGAGLCLGGGIGGALGLGLGGAAAPIAASVTHSINTRHFLAGRRSWAIKPASFFGMNGVRNPAALPADVWIIETAAIERYSHEAFRILDMLHLLGDFDVALRDVWSIFLNNFVHAMRFRPVPAQVWGNSHSIPRAIPNTVLTYRTFPVSFVEEHHPGRSPMESCRHFGEVTARFRQIYPP